MHIAIDASRTTVQRVTGTENYAIQLIRALIRLNTRHQISLYFRDIPPAHLFPSSNLVNHHIIPFHRAWTHLRFAAELWREKPDVTFVPAHILPVWFPGRAIVTVHDLGYKHFPQAHSMSQRWYLDWSTGYSARRADVILADSQATADDLTRFYDIPSKKIRVAYPGVDAPVVAGNVKEKYRLPERYFLFIGTLQPRKNIAGIVQAFIQWKATHPGDDTGLVLAGGKGWLFDESWTADVDHVYLLGYIDETDKGALYAGAIALVFPSLYEGFGFPVVEAMHCGTPVIASNSSSLPELVGDAGALVDPLNVEAIARAMGWMSDNPVIRQTLRVKGYQQALKFTWGATAKIVMEALENNFTGT